MTTKIGTNVIDLVFYHIFHNFQSDDRLRGRSLLRSRNLQHRYLVNQFVSPELHGLFF